MLYTYNINDNIYCFRGISHSDLDFHGSTIKSTEGSSYNCYLIIDDEITLIDTVDSKFSELFLDSLKTILDGRKIHNIIVNHVEPDHSGLFTIIKEKYPDGNVYCSKKGIDAMQRMYFKDINYTEVNDFDTIRTGKYTLKFILTPFVHWPDNMFTYLEEENILFSNDAFGSLLTRSKLYDENYSLDDLINSSKSYYANIVMPYGKFVLQVFEKLKTNNIKLKLICPSHGLVLKKYINELLENYYNWANYKNNDKVVIIYETIWGNTEMCTNQIANALVNSGREVKVFRASKHHPSTIITEVMDAKAILFGSSNFNSTMLSPLADITERIYALKPQNKIAMVYGSFGWANTHLKRLEQRLKEANIDILDFSLLGKYTPDGERLENAYQVGLQVNSKI